MGFRVKLLCWMVHCVRRMVHDGTLGETSDALLSAAAAERRDSDADEQ